MKKVKKPLDKSSMNVNEVVALEVKKAVNKLGLYIYFFNENINKD